MGAVSEHPVIEVLETGPLALLQDLGRPGLAASGVGRSGAADRAALCLANRLVANPEHAAGVEVLLGGFAVRADAAHLLALAGGVPVGHHALLALRAGQMLRLGPPAVGLRTYLAVGGGIDVAPVLGSRSTDLLSGVGPAPLTAGDLLPVGAAPAGQPVVDLAPVALPTGGGGGVARVVRAAGGPGGRARPPVDQHVDGVAAQRPGWGAPAGPGSRPAPRRRGTGE